MADGRGTYAELRARLGVLQVATPLALPVALQAVDNVEEAGLSPTSPSKRAPQPTGPQSKRNRRQVAKGQEGGGAAESGTVFAVCVGAEFNLKEMVTTWRVGSPVAMELAKLVNRLEFISE
jgi:hypothetical protein